MHIDGTIGFVGTGNMAEALIRGLLHANVFKPEQIVGSEPRPDRGEEMVKKYGITITASNIEVAKRSDIVILSIKPQVMSKVLDEIAPHVHTQALVISIAAGIPLAAIEAKLPKARVVRTMPNTPAGTRRRTICRPRRASSIPSALP
jgi:pyrroline-5-carboxylate reductase